jgi:hypothetical protein
VLPVERQQPQVVVQCGSRDQNVEVWEQVAAASQVRAKFSESLADWVGKVKQTENVKEMP